MVNPREGMEITIFLLLRVHKPLPLGGLALIDLELQSLRSANGMNELLDRTGKVARSADRACEPVCAATE